MRGWIIFLSLCAFIFVVHHSSKLLHNLSPSLRVVEKNVDVSNAEAEALGYRISGSREYFRKIIYKERKQTKGLRIDVHRDTISNEMLYSEPDK